MADAGVTGVVAKLGELAAAEATALLRVDAEIRVLRRKLAYLQALVHGADRQRRGRASELLLLWLRETREVAFEVEDAVDEFHLRVAAFHLRRRRASWWGWGWHRDVVCLVQGLVTQVNFAKPWLLIGYGSAGHRLSIISGDDGPSSRGCNNCSSRICACNSSRSRW